jgi:hypothetical protein
MFLRFVEAINPITNPQDLRVPAGLYAGILVRYSGHNQAAQTAVQTDFGTILVRHRGRNIVNARARDLYLHSELAGGFARWASAVGADYEFVFFIPFRYGEMPGGSDDNLLNAGPDELFVTIPQLNAVVFDTCVCEISVVKAPGVARFIPQISTQSVVLTANQPIRLSIPNQRRILMDAHDFTAHPATVFLTRGGNEVIFEGPYDLLESLSDMAWYREAAAIEACMVDLGRDDFASFVGGRYDLRMIGGTGTATVVEFGALPVSSEEFHAVRAVQRAALDMQYSASAEPPSSDVAPISPETVSSGGAAAISAPSGTTFARVSTVTPNQGPTVTPIHMVGSSRIGI